ncbi:MAG TPA: threonine/serine dehydratase [Candidatus Nanoarchaeia archaeon]|nr:threonine/serine dehydratase [Candidatus Nanoarchaeia archaeon]
MHDFADTEKITHKNLSVSPMIILMNTIDLNCIKEAHARINEFIVKTPLIKSSFYSDAIDGEAYLKLENSQLTNSFKIRGVLNKMLKLSDDEKKRGVLAVSSGNHAQGIGHVSKMLGINAKVVVPENTPKIKIDMIKKYGVELNVFGENYLTAEIKARELERKTGMVYISPYNDFDVIAGAGTVGLEILNELSDANAIIMPVGGGGLISGVAVAVKSINPHIKIIGAQSEASPVMHESVKAGKIVNIEVEESIAEGLQGGIEKNSVTFNLIKNYADEILLVSEDEIKDAMRTFLQQHNQIAEGSGAVGLAALVRYRKQFKKQKVAIVVSGGNFDREKLKMFGEKL